MALTVVFALIGSMVLSLTLMPVLASMFLPRRLRQHENFLVRGLKRIYRPILRWALRWRWAVVALALMAIGNAAFLATRIGAEFVPRLQEGTIVINTVRLASVSLDESVRYGTHIERLLLTAFPDEIERVWTRTGAAEVATDPMGIELSDVFVTLRPRAGWRRAETQQELMGAMQRELEAMPGMRAALMQPIEMRVNEMLAGIRSDVGVKVFGDDLAILKEKAKQIEALLKAIPGSADVVSEQATGLPLLRVEVDRVAIGRHGIAAKQVLQVVEALGAASAGELQEGERRFPIVVRLEDRHRADAGAVGKLLVTADNGDRIPLARLAHIGTSEGPALVNREWGKRRVVVQVNVRERDVASWVADAQRAIDRNVVLPEGYYVEFGGQFEQLQAAEERLLVIVPLALALVFLLLYLTYGRVLDALRVFTGVPLAAVGGIAALWICDIPFSVSAGVGFIALSGVAVLGDMVMVSTIRHNLGAGLPLEEAVSKAAEARLRPVLMTALVAALGFVPMALNTGIGAEVQRPLATVVIGGVVSSTALTLVVLPVLYLTFRRRPA
jgi:cobalt-zinc-cadmium resistance protein CzcA